MTFQESSADTINERERDEYVYIKWEKLNNDEIRLIDELVTAELSSANLSDAMTCSVIGCCKHTHHQQLSHFYEKLCQSVVQGREYFVKRLYKVNKFKVIPGWNRNVKHLYYSYREVYLKWISNGKIKDGIDYERMKETRKLFKHALNDCKINECRESSISIQEKYINKNMRSFWYDVQKKNNKTKYSETIDGKNYPLEVIQVFNKKSFNI